MGFKSNFSFLRIIVIIAVVGVLFTSCEKKQSLPPSSTNNTSSPTYLTPYQIQAFANYNGNLVAGGIFYINGQVYNTFVCRWDGKGWIQLGGNVCSSNSLSSISSLIVYNGSLVVGGSLDSSNGRAINNIAYLDSIVWKPLGSGMNKWVSALTVYNGNLIAGGSFTIAGGNPANYIAQWNGTVWQPLSSGMNAGVLTLTTYNGNIIAGGSFSNAGGNSANNIAQWNGSIWQPLGSGMNTGVLCLTTYNGNLIAGGSFSVAGGDSANEIAMWNGVIWQPLGNGTLANASLMVYNGQLAACGNGEDCSNIYQPCSTVPQVSTWNGTNWTTQITFYEQGSDGANDGAVLCLIPYNNNLVAGGTFSNSTNTSVLTGIAQWNGSIWSDF